MEGRFWLRKEVASCCVKEVASCGVVMQGGCFLLPGYAGQHQAMMQGREGSSSGHVEAVLD